MEQVSGRESTLRRALALTAVILVVELTGGLLSHSLALLSDAGHVLTDVFALGLAWFALAQSRRPADRRRSYGYQRVTVLAALLNAVTLIVIVLSLGIAVLIAYGAWGIVRETVNLLMEGTPKEVDLSQVTREITGTERVTGMHDLHVWALSSEETALSVHVVVGECPLSDAEHLMRDLEQRLCSRFDIGHTTIQVESCHPCGEIEHGAGAHNHPHEHLNVVASSSRTPRAAESGGRGR